MEQSFKKIAENLSITPSKSTWEKIENRLEIDRLNEKQKKYKRALNWVAAAAVISVLFNGIFLSGIIQPIDEGYNYMAHSSLPDSKEEQPFIISEPLTIDSDDNVDRRIVIRKKDLN